MTNIILVCADPFGLQILDLLRDVVLADEKEGREPRYRMCGYVSEEPAPFGELPCGLKRLGSPEDHHAPEGARYVLGVREPELKRRLVAQILSRGGAFETVISPRILMSTGVTFGEGAVVDAYSITQGVSIGAYATVCGAMLAGRFKVGDYATALYFSNLIGEELGEGAYVGSHVFLPHGKSVGAFARVHHGAIIASSIKDGAVVSGIPAKKVRAGRP